MPFDKIDIENITEERRKAVAKSIRVISAEELKKLGDEIFHFPEHPWREKLLQLIAENPGATFYHGVTQEGVVFLYCRDKDIGMWYLPGSGMGPLSAVGKKIMTEAIKNAR